MTGPPHEQPSAVDGVTAAETLRRVAKEVRAAFPRALRGPELVLIDVDPHHIHAFWTLPASTVDTGRRSLPGDGTGAPMVLRFHELSPSGADGAAFDVEVVGLQGRCYVDIWKESRRYRGELGLRRPDGTIVRLAGPVTVELPSLGEMNYRPAALDVAAPPPAPPPERPDKEPPVPAGEHVGHPFLLPPTEPSDFGLERLAPAPPAAGAVGSESREERPSAAEREPAVPSVKRVAVGEDMPQSPEPIRHPFPLPPLQPSEFVPEALIGGFLAPMEVSQETSASDAGAGAASHEGVLPESPMAGQANGKVPAAEEPAGPPVAPAPLPLENVLTVSSWVLGREAVEFEINAELHIFGRARSGAHVQLFGRKVTLRPDGSFSITQPLPNGALLLSSLLVDSDDESGQP